MCAEIDKMREKAVRSTEERMKNEFADRLIKSGETSPEKISSLSGVAVETVKTWLQAVTVQA